MVHVLLQTVQPQPAGLTLTFPFIAIMASLASSMFSKVTNPKPRDRWVSLSLTTTTAERGIRLCQYAPSAGNENGAPYPSLTFGDLPVLGEDLLQSLLVGVEAQPSHKKLAFI